MNRTLLLSILAVLLLLTTAPAQKAAFNSYGSPCPNTTAPLAVSGLPKLGSSFTVSGILFPGACTQKFCNCACCNCNTCRSSVLFVGIAKNNQILPGGCPFLVRPDVLILNGIRGVLTVQVPNQNSLIGTRFYMQRLDISLTEVTGTQCPRSYVPTAFIGTSNGVEGIAGL
jgi:hypothetical protein